MKATGKMISNMERVSKSGKKEVSMRESIVWEENRGMENMCGMMDRSMKETGLIIG